MCVFDQVECGQKSHIHNKTVDEVLTRDISVKIVANSIRNSKIERERGRPSRPYRTYFAQRPPIITMKRTVIREGSRLTHRAVVIEQSTVYK